MIIQCEQCRTKFKLDDEKVSDRGVKVRCAKCRHVFTVRKDAAEAADTEERAPLAAAAATAGAAEPSVAFDFGSAPEPTPAAAVDGFDLGQTDAAPAAADPGGFDFGATVSAAQEFSDKTVIMAPKKEAEPATSFDFDFGAASSSATPAAEPGSFDFGEALASSSAAPAAEPGSFDFGEALASGTDRAAQPSGFDFGAAAAPAAATEFDLGGFDFGAAVPVPDAAEKGSEAAFSFGDAMPQEAAAPADSFDLSGIDFSQEAEAAPTAKPAVDSFSLGDIDFSAEAAQVEVDTQAASVGALFAPVEPAVAEQQTAAPAAAITFEAPAAAEETPPLAISSRRRQSSLVSILIGVATVMVVGVLGYMAYSFISSGPQALSIFGKGGAPADEGRITVQNIKAYFIPKAVAGELLVITGDALNSYKKPRAGLQVKGMIYGANNQALATRTAFAGNQLTREQLLEMPLDKIEAAMNNQFGDSLTNLEVQPGKTIPFTIVLVNPPKEGKEFGVEPVGSTVAAAK